MPKRTNKKIKEYKLKNGDKRFYFQIYLGKNSNGKKIITTRRGFKSYSEAQTAYNLMTQTKADDFVKQKQITLDELYKLWFENYKHTVKDSTAYIVNSLYHAEISKYFGQGYVDQIQVKDLQVWADNLAKTHINYKRSINLLSTMFEYAIRLGYMTDNPMLRVIKPSRSQVKSREIKDNVYTQEELDRFLKLAKEVSPTVYTFFKLISSTGLRRGEALALTWRDIDFDKSTINVDKTLTVGNKLSTPKTKTSYRTVPMTAGLKQVLLDYRKNRKIIVDKVFSHNARYYDLHSPKYWLKQVYKLDQTLKRITVHGFRHTFATLLIANTSIKPKTVQMLLGHANIHMTMDVYTHIVEENKQDAIEAMKFIDEISS